MGFTYLYDVPHEVSEIVYDRVLACVLKHEKKRGKKQGEDCTVMEYSFGGSQILLFVDALEVLTPRLVAGLKRTMKAHPHWEVVAIICAPDEALGWPDMGLRIRGEEVVDHLKREYFPPRFQRLRFADARLPAAGEI